MVAGAQGALMHLQIGIWFGGGRWRGRIRPLAQDPQPRSCYVGVGLTAADRHQLKSPAAQGALQLAKLA